MTRLAGPSLARRILEAAKAPNQAPAESAATIMFGFPAGTMTTLGTSGTTGTAGPWVQMWAAGAQPLNVLLRRIVFRNGNGFANVAGTLDLGSGGAGAEAVIGQFRIVGDNAGTGELRLPVPLLIPGGTRVAARFYSAMLSAGFGPQVRNLEMVQDL